MRPRDNFITPDLPSSVLIGLQDLTFLVVVLAAAGAIFNF